MPYSKTLIEANNASRERMAKLAALDDATLQTSLGEGWTIATALAHIAFWDRRALLLLDEWERRGVVVDEPDPDLVNEIVQPFFEVLPPREAVRLAQEAAEALDRKLEMIPEPLVVGVMANHSFNPSRAAHRNEHFEDIDRVLGRKE